MALFETGVNTLKNDPRHSCMKTAPAGFVRKVCDQKSGYQIC